MSVKEFEGKNEEEAINKAIESLGLDRDDIDVEIVETRKAPFLFGGGRVRIRVHLEEERQPELEEREERQPRQPGQPREGRGGRGSRRAPISTAGTAGARTAAGGRGFREGHGRVPAGPGGAHGHPRPGGHRLPRGSARSG